MDSRQIWNATCLHLCHSRFHGGVGGMCTEHLPPDAGGNARTTRGRRRHDGAGRAARSIAGDVEGGTRTGYRLLDVAGAHSAGSCARCGWSHRVDRFVALDLSDQRSDRDRRVSAGIAHGARHSANAETEPRLAGIGGDRSRRHSACRGARQRARCRNRLATSGPRDRCGSDLVELGRHSPHPVGSPAHRARRPPTSIVFGSSRRAARCTGS